jgi:hypothetical protein
LPGVPNFAPHAKRVIYLFQNGAPSQLESFDHKPLLTKMMGQDLPASIRMGQRLTGMTSQQKKFPLVGSFYKFNQYGNSGAWVSELFPETAKIVDDICIIKSMHTEAINHDPALTFFQTGAQQGNRPSMGSWVSYGLGTEIKICHPFVCCCRAEKEMGKASTQSCGRMDSWIQCTRACNSAAAKIRSCICRILMEWTEHNVARCSIKLRS